MPEFLELLPPIEALERLLEHIHPKPVPEEVDTAQSLGRVTAEPVIAPHPLPAFPRATVDGFALIAADTFGASDSLPAYLRMIGEVPMGGAPGFAITHAQCALIHTGGMLPEGADSVVMIEHTQRARADEVEILRAVAPGENMLKTGEDVAAGEMVIPAGVRIRPAEIGGLMALGITRLNVRCCPRIAILSSGDEVVPPVANPRPGQVRDVNAYTLSALIQGAGGLPLRCGIVPDDEKALQAAAASALTKSDGLVITAGSSASTRDLTAQVIQELGKPGVLVHGVNVRPGKPTILAVCDGKMVIGLPGNPVSALIIAGLFVTPAIRALLGQPVMFARANVQARLDVNLASQAGREDWIPVRLTLGEDGFHALPIFGKSNLIFTLARADGLLRIQPDATGLSAGEMVEVYLA